MHPPRDASRSGSVAATAGATEIAQALGASLAALGMGEAAFALVCRESAREGVPRTIAASADAPDAIARDPRRIERALPETACVLHLLPREGVARAPIEAALEAALPAIAALARLASHSAALARSEARLVAALDGLPHPFWILDPSHAYAVQNRHDREAFGDLVGRTLAQVDLAPEMVAQWQETYDRVLAGETLRIDMVKETASGTIVGETVMAPIRIGEEVVGLVGLSIDQTERVRAEEELRRSEARLRDFLASTSDWLWETDAEHRFTAVYADAGRRGGGYKHWIGRTRWDVWGVDCDADPAWARYRRLVEAREPLRGHVLPIVDVDGTRRFVELTARPIHDEAGAFAGYRGATRDVTDRERIAERLRRSDLVAQLTRNPVIVADAQARIVWVNPAFEELTGYTLVEALGKRPDELLDGPESDPATTRLIREALARGEGVRTQVVNRTKDGRSYCAELDLRPILSDAGLVEGFVAVETDVTALLAAQARIAAIVDNVAAGIVLQDETGTVIDCNAEAARLLGLTREEATGRTSVDPRWRTVYEDGSPCPGDDHPGMRALRLRADVRDATIGVHTPDGSLRWLRVNAKLLTDLEGKTTILSSFTDVTADRNHSRSLAAAKEETERALAELDAYRAALDRHSMVAVLDARGRVAYVNDLLCATTGHDRAALVGRRPRLVARTKPRGTLADALRSLARGDSWRGELCARGADGTCLWVDTTLVPMGDAKAGSLGARAVAICYDISERKRAQAAVEAEMTRRADAELLLRDVLDTIPDAVAAFDRNDRLILFNEAYKDFYASSAPAIRLGATFGEMLRYGVERGQYRDAGETPETREAWIAERLEAHRTCRNGRLIQELDDGRWLQVRERRSRSGNVVGVRTDITSLKLAEAAIKRSAEQDALTGLANRRVLLDSLERRLAGKRAEDGAGALALLDLDHFKDVNDTLGHDIGDELLKGVADRLRQGVRGSDVVARLGGDEFAILLPGLSDPRIAQGHIAALHRAVNAEMTIAGHTLRPGVSIGVTLFPADGVHAGDLIKNADIALYQAKARGRNGWSFFDPSLRLRVERRHALAEALRRALAEEDAIDVAFQAQVETGSGRHAGFEALVRWNLDGCPVSPAEFVPLADETGLAPQLGRQVIARALARMRTLVDAGHEPGYVAVNVSAGQLKDPAFPETVRELLALYRLPPERLEIEVTETVLLDRSSDKIGATLAALHAQGLAIALDDFGTGYASLTHLKRFPVDRLKIDQSFVRDIGLDPEDAVIARTIVNLAHSLGMSVVAEGIETHDQLVFLRLHGCDLAQGYLIHRPSTCMENLVAHLETTRAPPKRYYRGTPIG
ncbi:EAL domain-containing protein [Salinarimonas sp.]|uniref:sensor domain-containing protein n=1 Tax=Salinarimonas sp. TaxID=2766526 RepID=UPI00391BB0D7